MNLQNVARGSSEMGQVFEVQADLFSEVWILGILFKVVIPILYLVLLFYIVYKFLSTLKGIRDSLDKINETLENRE